MARPRNTELKKKILEAFRKSFRASGYDASSYSAIASMCGIQRNLVQYHYPKKEELARLLLDEVLDGTHEALGLTPDDLNDDFSALYSVCVCYFRFLLQDGAYGRLLHDIVRDRALMGRVIPLDATWVLSHLERRTDASTARATNEIVASFGGYYALLYHALENNRAFDVAGELAPVMQAFMKADGYTDTEIERNAMGMRLDPTRMTVAVHRLNQRFL